MTESVYIPSLPFLKLLSDVSWQIIQRAQRDPEFQDSIGSLFDILHKWASKSMDVVHEAHGQAQENSLESFIDDPTGRIPAALRQFNVLVERLANGKPTADLFRAVDAVVDDARKDPELRRFISDSSRFVQKSLQHEDFAKSDAFDRESDELNRRYERLVRAETPQGQRLKAHTTTLADELDAYLVALRDDPDSQRLRAAFETLGKDIATATVENAGAASWIWQDTINVYLPRVFEYLKDIPIPR